MSATPVTVLLAVALVLAGCAAPRSHRLADAFSGEALRAPGPTVDFAPGRPTVINFFASWCAPCRREMRLLEAAHRQAGPAVDFIGVDEADSHRAALELLDASATTYPTVSDPDKRIAGRYRLEGMPTTLFVAAAGRVDAVVKGPLTAGQLRRRLGELRKA